MFGCHRNIVDRPLGIGNGFGNYFGGHPGQVRYRHLDSVGLPQKPSEHPSPHRPMFCQTRNQNVCHFVGQGLTQLGPLDIWGYVYDDPMLVPPRGPTDGQISGSHHDPKSWYLGSMWEGLDQAEGD